MTIIETIECTPNEETAFRIADECCTRMETLYDCLFYTSTADSNNIKLIRLQSSHYSNSVIRTCIDIKYNLFRFCVFRHNILLLHFNILSCKYSSVIRMLYFFDFGYICLLYTSKNTFFLPVFSQSSSASLVQGSVSSSFDVC